MTNQQGHPEVTPQHADAVKTALSAIAARWRGDWSEFDGRTLRDQLAQVTRLFDLPPNRALEEAAEIKAENEEANSWFE
jgi:hypothetical protein